MSTMHSPGPWFYKEQRRNRKKLIAGHEHGRSALIMSPGPAQFQVALVRGPSNAGDVEEWAANVRIMAAAPDLLAALEGLIPWIGKALADDVFKACVMPRGALLANSAALAAIAKAKGAL